MGRIVKILSVSTLCVILITGCSNNNMKDNYKENIDFDWQGHRGSRGLMPENTIPSFLKALDFPIKTLELDVVISKDNQIVVSHDPWMSSEICQLMDGTSDEYVKEQSYNIFKMNYSEIAQIDCGTKFNTRFLEQKKQFAIKPTLEMLVNSVNEYCNKNNKPLPNYNIELKSEIGWDDVFTPKPKVFADLVLKEVTRLGILEKTCFQSFDIRTLQELHNLNQKLTTALLVEDYKGLTKHLDSLGFTPTIFSPEHIILSKELVSKAHKFGMKVIPWTVNDVPTMKKLIEMGVDGIITDYPNLIFKVER